MLIDGELQAADAASLFEQLQADAALRERLGQLWLDKARVRHAYAGVEAPPRPSVSADPRATPAARRWRPAAGAFAALACGVVVGFAVQERAAAPGADATPLAGHTAAAPQGGAGRVILHVSAGQPLAGLAVLERAEGILEAARSAGRQVSVEVVANSEGLDLLREGVSAHAARIASLRATYPGLSLVACGQTAQRLREGGTEVRLLPGTRTASSALDEIVLRMQQGWAYVRV
ncbi:MAG: hypothetical protein C0505_08350 [Leptothrix sp. (in: Bacteria)]|nr:hypothetical protein [Leptothrix sp. (in: b-proteobacteria)]